MPFRFLSLHANRRPGSNRCRCRNRLVRGCFNDDVLFATNLALGFERELALFQRERREDRLVRIGRLESVGLDDGGLAGALPSVLRFSLCFAERSND